MAELQPRPAEAPGSPTQPEPADPERRARVQGEPGPGPNRRPTGSIAWSEHVEAWKRYAKTYNNGQTAERIHERGGFGYEELVALLGHEPKTWRPARFLIAGGTEL